MPLVNYCAGHAVESFATGISVETNVPVSGAVVIDFPVEAYSVRTGVYGHDRWCNSA